jgi:DNA-binding transcriptional LysR family regulator
MKLVAVPADHPLCAQREISWYQLAKERFLVPKDGAGPDIQRHILRRLATPGVDPDIAIHDLGPDDLLHLVAMNFGVMLTNESTIGAISPGVVLLRLIDEEPLLWNAIWLGANRNQSLHSILAIAQRHLGAVSPVRNHTSE